METTLLIVTAVSLIVALSMSFTAWRLNREERRRSAARIAALSTAAGPAIPDPEILEAAVAIVAPRAVEFPKAPWTPSPRLAVQEEPRFSRLEQTLEAPRQDAHGDSRPILGTTEAPQESRGRQRGLAAAAAVLFVLLLSGLAWPMVDRQPGVASAEVPSAPLELVSLRHERQSSKLSVSGLVRNPAAGRPVDHLAAVVFLFDQQGSFVTSAKAPVDFVRLGSGDESPFVVTIDAPASIARYRVSFRTDQGIVPHVDRRGASPIAGQSEQAASLKVK